MSTRGDSLSQFVRAQLADGSDKESPRARRSAPRSRDQQILRRAGALLSCTATDVDRSAAAGATGPTARRRSESQLRVVPGGRGGWRVEGIAGEHALCTTITEAEREAERLLRAAGGGEMCVYDAYLRVRRGEAARSRPTHSPTSADQHVARGAPSILTTAEPVPSTTQSTPRRSPSCGAPRGARSLARSR